MIVWRGWGLLPVVIAALALAAMMTLDEFRLRSHWIQGAPAFAAAVANWFVGRAFNRPLEQAGIGYWKRHWLLFIQMEWWSVFFVYIGFNMVMRGTLF